MPKTTFIFEFNKSIEVYKLKDADEAMEKAKTITKELNIPCRYYSASEENAVTIHPITNQTP